MNHQTTGLVGEVIAIPTNPNEKRSRQVEKKVLDFLNEQLVKLEQVGKVVTVLVYNQRKNKVSCFGKWIRDEALRLGLNASVEKTIAYPKWHQLTSWSSNNHGDLVRLKEFEPRYDDDLWVALIGDIPVDSNRHRLRFPAS